MNNPKQIFGQVTDIDGNVYKTVIIGGQEWMAENLNVSRFRNGDTIRHRASFLNINGPVCCYYPGSINQCGKLYNGETIKDPRGVAPEGWHIPNDAEWATLAEYLGGSKVAGGKMKSSDGWAYYNVENGGAGTNESGFTGLPGGLFEIDDGDGKFSEIGMSGWWHCISDDDWYWWLSEASSELLRFNYWGVIGLSIRCVRD